MSDYVKILEKYMDEEEKERKRGENMEEEEVVEKRFVVYHGISPNTKVESVKIVSLDHFEERNGWFPKDKEIFNDLPTGGSDVYNPSNDYVVVIRVR